MSRYVFPAVVLLALVGGYVVGQQPDQRIEDRPLRYLPSGESRMLDTKTGTLYSVSGQEWATIARLPPVP